MALTAVDEAEDDPAIYPVFRVEPLSELDARRPRTYRGDGPAAPEDSRRRDDPGGH